MSYNKIAFFVPSLRGGGAEKVTVNLIKGFLGKGYEVDLILAQNKGPYLKEVPKKCRIFDLNVSRTIFVLPKLIHYLYKEKPYVLISGMSHANVIAIISKTLVLLDIKTVVIEHNTLSKSMSSLLLLQTKFMPFLVKLTYPKADRIIAVSSGVANDLNNVLNIPSEKINFIYNPIIDEKLFDRAKQPVEHSWFNNSAPVILSVGRLSQQKNYSLLLSAFSIIRKKNDCRLVILGEGEERQTLESLAKKLEINSDLWMPGFVDNPYKYMSKAAVFVLPSNWEGFGNVIVEAMACGCPVVCTDCPNGPAEILKSGVYGELVPVEDVEKLAEAIQVILNSSIKSTEKLLARANNFSVDNIVEQYQEVIHGL